MAIHLYSFLSIVIVWTDLFPDLKTICLHMVEMILDLLYCTVQYN